MLAHALLGTHAMLESIFTSSNYQASKVLLDVTSARHKVMAGNLANLDTPGYKRLDIDPDFRTELQASIRNKDIMGFMHIREPEIKAEEGLKATRLDGNNVSLDRELMEINQNALEYQAMAQFVSSSLNRLRTAVTGRAE